MPLPTPRSVISSPSHMMRPVPAVTARMVSRYLPGFAFGIGSTVHSWKIEELATDTITEAWRTAKKIVR